MTKRVRPHPLFSVWRADEAAECLPLNESTYRFLWNTIVPLQPKLREDREEPTYEYPLRNYWSQVPPAIRRELNQAAAKHEAEYMTIVGEPT